MKTKDDIEQSALLECNRRYPNMYDPARTVFMDAVRFVLDMIYPNETETDAKEDDPSSIFLSLKGLTKAVAQCSNETDLMQLYNDNKERIDNSPGLKQLFTIRKNQLRRISA